MIDKRVSSLEEAVAGVFDGAIIMISGFAAAGSPLELMHALVDQGAKDLIVVNNNAGSGHVGMAALIGHNRVRKLITSFPRTAHSVVFPEYYKDGKVELELVPQGTLAERIRAGGAGVPAFYTPTAVGTPLAEGKEIRSFDGKQFVLEYGIKADFSFIKCEKSDRYGNLTYDKTGRNFGPIMAMAAKTTCVQTSTIVGLGEIHPEEVVTPGIFVKRVVEVPEPVHESVFLDQGRSYP